MCLIKDLFYPLPEEKRKYKKCLVQSPNSSFMDVKCPGCYKILSSSSHRQRPVLHVSSSTVFSQPARGK
ncbi:40S ribosomal protein S27-like [Pteronotus mesoamericanus]|uniref:40S ribosomal protein S27-like n=1 Tax=Pteronotus mesoamericanus TaxID=1884717 RepID=UPI0023EE1DD5|nr:40S ribosomal protein S27-like [Pteronotus parnellii mesoamericanus]